MRLKKIFSRIGFLCAVFLLSFLSSNLKVSAGLYYITSASGSTGYPYETVTANIGNNTFNGSNYALYVTPSGESGSSYNVYLAAQGYGTSYGNLKYVGTATPGIRKYFSPSSCPSGTFYTVTTTIYSNVKDTYNGGWLVTGSGEIYSCSVELYGNDSTAPTVTISADYTGLSSAEQNITISATDNLGIDHIEYHLDNWAYATYTGSLNYPGNGAHSVTARAVDKAGNYSSVKTVSWTRDSIAPDAPTISLSRTGWGTSSVDYSISTSDNAGGSGMQYYWKNIDYSGWVPYSNSGIVYEDGIHTIQATGVDNAGNESSITTVYAYIDSVSPTVTISADYTGLSNAEQNITIYATDNLAGIDHIEYQFDNWPYATYTGTLNYPGNGTHSVTARAVDRAGNYSSAQTVSWTRDSIAPDAPTISLSRNGWGTSSVDYSISTNDNPGGSGLQYYRKNIDYSGWVPYSNSGTVSGNGIHTIQATGVDNAGNESSITTVYAYIDTVPPSAPTVNPSRTSWGNTQVTFTVTPGTDNESGYNRDEYSIDNGPWIPYLSAVPVTSEGWHYVKARTFDNVGYFTESSTVSFGIDTTAPTAPTIHPSRTSWGTSSPTFYIDGSSDPNGANGSGVAKYQYKIDNSGWTDYLSTVTVSAEGWHTISARAVDAAGNPGPEATQVSFGQDTTAPSIVILTPSRTSWGNTAVSITLSGGDDQNGSNGSGFKKYQYSLDDNTSWQDYSTTIIVLKTNEKWHTVYARSIDNVGNISAESQVSFGIDITLPDAAASIPSNTLSRTVNVTLSGITDGALSQPKQARVANDSGFVDTPGWVSVTGTSASLSITMPVLNPYLSNYSNRTVYVQLQDNAGNIRDFSLMTKYDARNPDTPVITAPSDDTLAVVSEPTTLTWSYSDPNTDPAALPLTMTDIIVYNRENSTTITYTQSGSATSYELPELTPGIYDISVRVYNGDSKTAVSNSILFRKNRFHSPGLVISKQIVLISPIKYLEVLTNLNVDDSITKPPSTNITLKVIYPPYGPNDYIATKIHNVQDAEQILMLPVKTNTFKLQFELSSTDNRFTSILDNVEVLGK